MEIIKFVTFNLRCIWKTDPTRAWGHDKINDFIHRAGFIYDKIMAEQPDIIAFQEVTDKHLKLLERMLPEYSFYGQFREKDFTGEGLYTAVRKERMQVLSFDTFWVSPTPYVAGSRYENQSQCPRICPTVKVRDKVSGKIFRTFNVHLDHISDEARVLGIECILDRAELYLAEDDIPFIIAGDFNAEPDSPAIKLCNKYKKHKIFDVTDKIKTTFHNWGQCSAKIDYIYVTGDIKKCTKAVYAWDDTNYGIYLSDHYGVCMEFDLNDI